MSTSDHGAAYRALRERVRELVLAAPPGALDRPSPATPEWKVRDLLAHLVGVTNDVVSGRLDGVATDAWTGRQVDERRGADLDALLAEWDEYAERFDATLTGAPDEISGQAVFDAVTHEHDMRAALRAPGARDSDAVGIAWSWVVEARTRGGGPAIRCETDDGVVVAGGGEPLATVRASRFELLRAMSGRRTASEIASYGWDPEPRPDLLLAAPIFTMREMSLAE